jgi:hypothetical protein
MLELNRSYEKSQRKNFHSEGAEKGQEGTKTSQDINGAILRTPQERKEEVMVPWNVGLEKLE